MDKIFDPTMKPSILSAPLFSGFLTYIFLFSGVAIMKSEELWQLVAILILTASALVLGVKSVNEYRKFEDVKCEKCKENPADCNLNVETATGRFEASLCSQCRDEFKKFLKDNF